MRHQAWSLLLVVVAACAESSTEPKQSDGVEFAGTMATLGSSSFIGVRFNAPLEMSCPGGGSRRNVTGQAGSTQSGDVVTSLWQFTTQHVDCTMVVNGMSLITNGTTHSEGRAVLRLPADVTQRPTILALEARDSGTMTTKVGNESHTCSFDLTQSYDASSNQLRIAGRACGQSVDFRRPV